MSENIASIINKVQKLLALAGNNPSEAESAAATAAAERLISTHRLSQADLEVRGETESESFERSVVYSGGRRLNWQETILGELCQHFGGYWFYETYREGGIYHTKGRKGSKGVLKYTCVAKLSDLEIIKYMFSYLCGEVDRLARWNCGGQGIAVSNGYRCGCASGIASQFRDMRTAERAAQAQSSAMVLLDSRAAAAKEVAYNLFPNLKKGAAIAGGTDYNARSQGYADGKKVQIRKGVGEGSNMRSIGGKESLV